MTQNEKNSIIRMRSDGVGYARIAQELGVNINTIKTFCRRSALTGVAAETGDAGEKCCPQCGSAIDQIPGRKEKKFCSDLCRTRWWYAHLDQVDRKAFYSFTCPICGSAFESYGNSHRKYCSRACANAARRSSDGP